MITPNKSIMTALAPNLNQPKCLMESSAHSDYHQLFGLLPLCSTLLRANTHTHMHIPQIPNYKEQRSVRRCLIKTTDQLTAQLAWLIRGSVGTKARSPLLSYSWCLSLTLSLLSRTHTHAQSYTHTLSQGLSTGHGCR